MTAEILEPRRRPTQERSQKKFDHLLQVSRELLLEVGFESFTCEEVATVRSELRTFAEAIPTLDWLKFLDRLIDHMAALWVSHPSRRAVWLAVQSTPATRATAAVTERELAAEVSRALAPLTPGTPRERRTIMAEVLVHVAYSMLNFSIRDGQEHSESIIELKRLLAAYLLSAEA